MRFITLIWISAVVAGAIGCASHRGDQLTWVTPLDPFAEFTPLAARTADGPDRSRRIQEDDILEAVFRWQLDNHLDWMKQRTGGYYISIGKKRNDPSEVFMKRFENYVPPVMKNSESRLEGAMSVVVDSTTGEQGDRFNVTSIFWISDKNVEVKGGHFSSGLGG